MKHPYNTRRHWADYYIARYNRDPGNIDAERMALWMLILIEAFGEGEA